MASVCAREMATFIRFLSKRNSNPRGPSSPALEHISDLFSGPNGSPALIEMLNSDLEAAADSDWTAGQDKILPALKTL
jgi:hypothetical protein